MYNVEHVASWWTTVTDKNGLILDNVFISYEDNNVIAFLPFKRSKACVYSESMEDYITTYSKNAQFLTLLSKLKNKRQHIVKCAA